MIVQEVDWLKRFLENLNLQNDAEKPVTVYCIVRLRLPTPKMQNITINQNT